MNYREWSKHDALLNREQFLELHGLLYIDFLKLISDSLDPQSYFEIGTETGLSCSQFKCPSVCVDPGFKLSVDIIHNKTELHLFQKSSDLFFREGRLGGIFPQGVDVCFLDGMHRCEYLLRDFMNAERHCHLRSLVFMHDCMPQNHRMALRTHIVGDDTESEKTRYAWTGDVWRIVPILLKYRPDLQISLIDCPPSGLVALRNLDSASKVIEENYFEIVQEMRDLIFEENPFDTYCRDVDLISSRALMERPENITLFFNNC